MENRIKQTFKPVQTMKKDQLESELFHIGLVFLAVGAGLGAVYVLLVRDILPQLPCLLYASTGIYCPGCGGTRAIKALLQGRFLLSLWYHPLIPYGAVIAGGFMLTQGLHRLGFRKVRGWKFHSWYLYVSVIIIVCNFLLKNLLLFLGGIEL